MFEHASNDMSGFLWLMFVTQNHVAPRVDELYRRTPATWMELLAPARLGRFKGLVAMSTVM